MNEESKHAASVDAWMGRLPKSAAPEQLVSAFERGFGAMWRRTQVTLGSVTLSAIADRVLHDASQDFPLLAVLKIANGDAGIDFTDFRKRVTAQDAPHLRDGIRALFVRFLTVIGNLTGQILTPALHASLDQVTLGEPVAHRPTGQTLERGGAER